MAIVRSAVFMTVSGVETQRAFRGSLPAEGYPWRYGELFRPGRTIRLAEGLRRCCRVLIEPLRLTDQFSEFLCVDRPSE
jgi:hypothetical protein